MDTTTYETVAYERWHILFVLPYDGPLTSLPLAVHEHMQKHVYIVCV